MPKPHTPFQWAAQCDAATVDRRLAALGSALRSDPGYGRSIGYRYHDGRPSIIEGLLARGDRRVAKVIRAVWEDGGRFDGWSEYFSYERWERCAADALAGEPVDLAWYTTRERGYAEVLPWDHLDAGLDREWLWQDWDGRGRPAGAAEVEDCRWTPATTVASARPWAPRSRSGRPASRCFRCLWSAERDRAARIRDLPARAAARGKGSPA